MKNKLFSYDAGIVTPLSIRYDECPRPRRGFFVLRIGDYSKKLPARRVPARPWCGSLSYVGDFQGPGVN
jgi:hypothetical protein